MTGTALIEQKADGRRRLAESGETKTVVNSGGVESLTTASDGTLLYTLVDDLHDPRFASILVVAADNSSVKITSEVLPVGGSSRRLTALSADESREHRRLGEEKRRRRLAEVAGDATLELELDNVRDPTGLCLAYHCFAGDDGCDEPATRDMCAEWSDDGRACLEPLCTRRPLCSSPRHPLALGSRHSCLHSLHPSLVRARAAYRVPRHLSPFMCAMLRQVCRRASTPRRVLPGTLGIPSFMQFLFRELRLLRATDGPVC